MVRPLFWITALVSFLASARVSRAFQAPAPVHATAGPMRGNVRCDMITPEAVDLSTQALVLAQVVPTSPEPIHTAFKVATFLSQPFFIMMTLFPKAAITKKIMGGLGKSRQLLYCRARPQGMLTGLRRGSLALQSGSLCHCWLFDCASGRWYGSSALNAQRRL